MSKPSADREVWFFTGSQDLYGEDTLRQVAEQSQEVARLLDTSDAWKPRSDFTTSAECWLTAGGAHHTVMTTNVPVDTWVTFADMACTELLVIDEHTTKRGFAEQVRANQAYYRLARRL